MPGGWFVAIREKGIVNACFNDIRMSVMLEFIEGGVYYNRESCHIVLHDDLQIHNIGRIMKRRFGPRILKKWKSVLDIENRMCDLIYSAEDKD